MNLNNQTMIATLATTIVTLHLMSFEPIKDTTSEETSTPETYVLDGFFEPQYRVINGKFFPLTEPIVTSIEAASNFLEIGNFLFKNSRDISAEESAMMHNFIQKRYKKLKI